MLFDVAEKNGIFSPLWYWPARPAWRLSASRRFCFEDIYGFEQSQVELIATWKIGANCRAIDYPVKVTIL